MRVTNEEIASGIKPVFVSFLHSSSEILNPDCILKSPGEQNNVNVLNTIELYT